MRSDVDGAGSKLEVISRFVLYVHWCSANQLLMNFKLFHKLSHVENRVSDTSFSMAIRIPCHAAEIWQLIPLLLLTRCHILCVLYVLSFANSCQLVFKCRKTVSATAFIVLSLILYCEVLLCTNKSKIPTVDR